ncbi:PREDICTED: BTB/POZ domain-containing protein KCTD5-like [Amphimedon queenslandica]|uniref:BTB domain-containing protein n=1 Tax=Amphimedon queenslandica TaxID=400682 RepID=A0A1X7V8M4_AMPQE|nr:PREDICTED: BTB/POZ domain-containing protein KCTD5-like [Amphimedon queenslandica]|eukprot:XP_003385403.1 PREDICTED: BTB/POZ domain-containing protein KCTD5-like [Amphimedon queenslandica]
MASEVAAKDEWVKLNVGGTLFMTTKTTLCKEKKSFLARLCLDDPDLPSLKDETGAYLIDRDSRYFPVILNYLRHGKIIVEPTLHIDGVLEEAEFYNIQSLVEQLTEKKNGRDTTVQVGDQKQVYRVLHCQEGELTRMLSTLSDGWKMTQLVNIGSQYSYSSDDQSEFLVVVSKEFEDPPAARSDSKPTNKERVLTERGYRI